MGKRERLLEMAYFHHKVNGNLVKDKNLSPCAPHLPLSHLEMPLRDQCAISCIRALRHLQCCSALSPVAVACAHMDRSLHCNTYWLYDFECVL